MITLFLKIPNNKFFPVLELIQRQVSDQRKKTIPQDSTARLQLPRLPAKNPVSKNR